MINLHNVECLSFMKAMEDNSVDAIVTDPPYFGVKDDDWDNQWKNADHFIEWIGELSEQWQRILKPNGSLYCFASPQLRARVEVKISERFNCLPSITWVKNDGNVENSGGKWRQAEKEAMRSYFPRTEAIIFAEQFGTDEAADGEAGYTSACEAVKRGVFGDYLRAEFERAGVTSKRIAALFPSASGGLTGCVSNWLLGYNWPTPDQYQKMRETLGAGFLVSEYEDLRREYEDLRREYEDLRREYEDLRRPFNVTADVPYTDVWTFKTVQAYPGKHVCEKPLALMEHIILASTKPGAIVFDPFIGSGSTGVAAVLNGRSFIGCEMEAKHFKNASDRIRKSQAAPRLFDAPKETFTQLSIEPE